MQLEGTYRVSGATSLGQVAHIVKNSMLHVGADSFPTHIASSYDKKIVALYSNNHLNCAKPLWGDPDNQILLEPDRPDGKKPSFSAEENPKTINSISPEVIAKSVLELLKLRHQIYHETICYGKLYSPSNLIYETTLENVLNIEEMGIPKILCRMDFNHNEEILRKQLEKGPSEIVTNDTMDINILEEFRHNITGVIYHIRENDDPKFAQGLYDLGLQVALVSELNEEKLSPKKINYMDMGLIREIKPPNPKEEELKEVDLNKLYYKSNKFTMSLGKIYPSRWAWENDMEIKHKDYISEAPDDEMFWKESNNFRFLIGP